MKKQNLRQVLMERPVKKNQGFTLIELLVVIAIIAVLVTIVVVAINPVRLIGQARDSKMRSDLNSIKAAMQLYYNDCKSYPSALPSGAWGGSVNSGTCDDGTTYMRQVPNNSGVAFLYAATTSGGAACTTAANNCANYTIGADLNHPITEDGNTLTKCSAPVPVGTHDFRVCND